MKELKSALKGLESGTTKSSMTAEQAMQAIKPDKHNDAKEVLVSILNSEV